MRIGKEFELLVATIERAVHNFPGTKVEHNVKMCTNYGVDRQIDVLITEERGRFIYKTIIECKDSKAKVKINIVAAFRDLMRSVGAHQGIIVTSSGFQSGAQALAKESNIFLYQLSEVEKHLKEQRFSVYEIKHSNRVVTVKFRNPTPINNEISLYSKLLSPLLNREVTIADVAQDFLSQKQNEIADTFLRSMIDPSQHQLIRGTTNIAIHFPSPVIFATGDCFTEIIGFNAEIDTQLTTLPANVKNVTEYKDIIHRNTHALVYELEHRGETHRFIETK